MKVQVGTYAGFCFGVDRAVQLVEEAAKAGGTVVTLGPIIHNRHVVDRFARMGVEVVEDPSAVPAGSTVDPPGPRRPPGRWKRPCPATVRVVDATCPFVKRIHRLVQEAEAEGRVPVIIGTRTHPEVVGIASWCQRGVVLESPEELERWAASPGVFADLPICMVSQTTLTANLWNLVPPNRKKTVY